MWSRINIMATIQVVLDRELLKAANREAKRARVNRSALIRDALREYLKQRELRQMVEREREAYRRQPQTPDEYELWEKVAAWPEP